MPPDPDTPRRAWVCAPGVRRIPHLASFLPDFQLSAAPAGDTAAVLGWGLKPTAAAGRAWARRRGVPYIALEDGFLRSVGLGEAGATSLSLVVDDLGVYYDATRPSRLETLIATAPEWLDAVGQARTRALIDRIVDSGISKTNMGRPLDPMRLPPGRRILLVDQTLGDASIAHGLAETASFDRMIAAARRDEPDAQLIAKRHPAVAAGRKQGCITDLNGVTLIDEDVRPADLLAAVDEVYTVTSGLGFEALLRGLPVRCFGAPFYAGWGLTRDEIDTGRRGQARSLEAVAAAALIRYREAEQALERLIALRDRADRLAGFRAGVGFAPAKRGAMRHLLNSPKGRLRYFASPRRAARAAAREGGAMVYWAGKETAAIRQAADAGAAPIVRIEDGFIRSRGLGSDFFGALSIALDDLGIYYDPSRPSRLETLIQQGEPAPAMLTRAATLRRRIVEAGLSKYNLRGAAPTGWPTDRERVLVVGQVENDRSILLGCGELRTNAGLLAAARKAFPEAFLIYRNHPDVMAGNRPGRLAPDEVRLADAVADDLDIIDCVRACDRVATLTSLTGFEALLRGKAVSTWGRPFYAGWGLTDDRLDIPRRTRRASLDALVAAALIAYPVYVAPNGWPCEAEDLVESLIAARNDPPPAAPAHQLARWWKGVLASLDRRPPPSY